LTKSFHSADFKALEDLEPRGHTRHTIVSIGWGADQAKLTI
jgi:hypothetical protein